MTVEQDSNENQIYDLEAYFDSKEIDTMLKDFCEKDEFIIPLCSYMKGIEKNGQFIPQEIKLIDTNTNKEYVLGKADINAITLGYTNITSDSNVAIEFIGFNTTHKVSKTLKELKEKDHKDIQLGNNMIMLSSRSSKDIKY